MTSSIRAKMRLAGRAKKEARKAEKEAHMAIYLSWFTKGLLNKLDRSRFTSTELIAWGAAAGLSATNVRNKLPLITRTFGYMRALNPTTKDGRHWKKGKTYMVYVKVGGIEPEEKENAGEAVAELLKIIPSPQESITEPQKERPEEPKPFKPSWKL